MRLLLGAGVPPAAITLLPGDGRIGAALVAHAGVDGVAFTGSVEVARLINRALAAKEGAIVPLIAETGGQNAMMVAGKCGDGVWEQLHSLLQPDL